MQQGDLFSDASNPNDNRHLNLVDKVKYFYKVTPPNTGENVFGEHDGNYPVFDTIEEAVKRADLSFLKYFGIMEIVTEIEPRDDYQETGNYVVKLRSDSDKPTYHQLSKSDIRRLEEKIEDHTPSPELEFYKMIGKGRELDKNTIIEALRRIRKAKKVSKEKGLENVWPEYANLLQIAAIHKQGDEIDPESADLTLMKEETNATLENHFHYVPDKKDKDILEKRAMRALAVMELRDPSKKLSYRARFFDRNTRYKTDLALKMLEHDLKIDPTHIPTLNILSQSYKAREDFNNANEIYRRLRGIEPYNASHIAHQIDALTQLMKKEGHMLYKQYVTQLELLRSQLSSRHASKEPVKTGKLLEFPSNR